MGVKKTVFLKMMLVCVISLNACAEVEKNGDGMPSLSSSETSEDTESESIELEYTESEDIKSESTELEEVSSGHEQWRVNLCAGMPESYIDVLRQYEQFLNADNQDFNDESVRNKLYGGEWEDLYDELCGSLLYYINRDTGENIGDVFHYSLTDITGDGFPELVIAWRDIPEVIYNYSETNGIGREFGSSYYTMTIYENGIVEYFSGRRYSSTTYLQFQENVGDWVVLDNLASEGTWDDVEKKWKGEEYYTGDWDGTGSLTETISEEEYLQIQEKYVTEPMKFEWVPFAYYGG